MYAFITCISSPSHDLGHFGYLLKQANTSRGLPWGRKRVIQHRIGVILFQTPQDFRSNPVRTLTYS
jgi:hypothetical protein